MRGFGMADSLKKVDSIRARDDLAGQGSLPHNPRIRPQIGSPTLS